MQQNQVIGIDILSGDCGGKIVCIDIKKCGSQVRSLKDAVSQMSKSVSLAITGGEGEASILDKLQNYPSHVLILQKSQQLAGEAMSQAGVISRCQVDKHCTGLLFCFKRILDILHKQNALVHA